MLERDEIQTRGFRNTVESGEITGFQIRVRSKYYKGIWLSQLRPGKVVVDGEEFPKNEIVWNIEGRDYTPAEMENLGNIHWSLLKPATLKIRKPGGLPQGYHDVSVQFGYSASYMPPSFDDPETGVGHGPNIFFKRMLIV